MAVQEAKDLVNQGGGMLSSIFNFVTKPSTLIAATVGLGLYIQSGGLMPAAETAGKTILTGLETATDFLSDKASDALAYLNKPPVEALVNG